MFQMRFENENQTSLKFLFFLSWYQSFAPSVMFAADVDDDDDC